MFKTRNNKAWLGVLPVVLIVSFSGVIPLMAVVNYSVQDILDFNARFFVGLQWYQEALQDPRFIDAFLRQIAFSINISSSMPLGIIIARGMPRTGWTARNSRSLSNTPTNTLERCWHHLATLCTLRHRVTGSSLECYGIFL